MKITDKTGKVAVGIFATLMGFLNIAYFLLIFLSFFYVVDNYPLYGKRLMSIFEWTAVTADEEQALDYCNELVDDQDQQTLNSMGFDKKSGRFIGIAHHKLIVQYNSSLGPRICTVDENGVQIVSGILNSYFLDNLDKHNRIFWDKKFTSYF